MWNRAALFALLLLDGVILAGYFRVPAALRVPRAGISLQVRTVSEASCLADRARFVVDDRRRGRLAVTVPFAAGARPQLEALPDAPAPAARHATLHHEGASELLQPFSVTRRAPTRPETTSQVVVRDGDASLTLASIADGSLVRYELQLGSEARTFTSEQELWAPGLVLCASPSAVHVVDSRGLQLTFDRPGLAPRAERMSRVGWLVGAFGLEVVGAAWAAMLLAHLFGFALARQRERRPGPIARWLASSSLLLLVGVAGALWSVAF